ncbi:hypothetical protein [Mesonia sp. K7]|uniref:hypothetical protein n=1 Tax=Mesonia sp. K7 TaxID=2218606 RepID=UPI000DA6FAC4|nr:hypothetical protein [Mesonia sp. K7]PZD77229.1 hypothetical protein DNG35_09140 [Mesonia sp. K7]
MKNLVLFIALTLVIASCDDGDIIVTDFDFDEESQLQLCNNNEKTIVFAINTDPSESIFLEFNDPDFSGAYPDLEQNDTIVQINTNNKLTYRSFRSNIDAEYFCNAVPPANIDVTEEYVSTNGGQVTFVRTSTPTNEDDADQDGIPDVDEGRATEQDSDGDGIADYLDTDDDNDNVLTSNEINLAIENPEDEYPDTDGDGIPNYLDTDDDNDGTPTRNEDLNAEDNDTPENVNPANDDTDNDGIPNYLDTDDSASVSIVSNRLNILNRSFKNIAVAENVTLKNSANGEEIKIETLILGSFTVSASVVISNN